MINRPNHLPSLLNIGLGVLLLSFSACKEDTSSGKESDDDSDAPAAEPRVPSREKPKETNTPKRPSAKRLRTKTPVKGVAAVVTLEGKPVLLAVLSSERTESQTRKRRSLRRKAFGALEPFTAVYEVQSYSCDGKTCQPCSKKACDDALALDPDEVQALFDALKTSPEQLAARLSKKPTPLLTVGEGSGKLNFNLIDAPTALLEHGPTTEQLSQLLDSIRSNSQPNLAPSTPKRVFTIHADCPSCAGCNNNEAACTGVEPLDVVVPKQIYQLFTCRCGIEPNSLECKKTCLNED